jgi:hypothetical protein
VYRRIVGIRLAQPFGIYLFLCASFIGRWQFLARPERSSVPK